MKSHFAVDAIQKKLKHQKLVSNCCGARPDGEVDKFNTGRCSKCKDGAVFFPEGEVCVECGEHRPDDERVKGGMNCRCCTNNYNHKQKGKSTMKRQDEIPYTYRNVEHIATLVGETGFHHIDTKWITRAVQLGYKYFYYIPLERELQIYDENDFGLVATRVPVTQDFAELSYVYSYHLINQQERGTTI
jgi:hypothetical protein